jgi:hypothetical protein
MPNASAKTSTPSSPDAGDAPAWFVQAAGQVWGPYSPVRLARFVAEGRVTPQSLLSVQRDGPFHPAERWESLGALFQAPKPYRHQPAPMATPKPSPPEPSRPEPEPEPQPEPEAPTASARPLLVWAELSSLSADQFESLLARHGTAVAIRPTVWLLQAGLDPAALRNTLSRRLTGADALMIVHAPLDQAAWFNLDSAAERRLRQVWGGAG